MSEYPRAKPDLPDATWCDGLGSPTVVEPDPGLKAAGYAAADKPAHSHWNWIHQLIGYVFDWLRGCVVRRFPTLAEAIAATEPGDMFQVYNPQAQGATILTKTPFAAPLCWTVDGGQLYVCTDEVGHDPRVPSLRAYHGSSGVQAWSALTDNDLPHSICSDGAYVFVASVSGAGPYTTEIEQFDAVTGALIQKHTIAVSWNPTINGMAANGAYLVAIGDTTTDAAMKVWSYTGAGMTLVGTATLCDVLGAGKACAISDRWAVMVGAQNPASPESNAIMLVQLSTAAELVTLNIAAWSKNAGVDYGFLGVATDGQRILCTGHPMDSAGGTNYRSASWFTQDQSAAWMTNLLLLAQETITTELDGACSLDDEFRMLAETSGSSLLIADKLRNTVHELSLTGDIGTTPTATVRESLDGMGCWIWDGTNFVNVQLHQGPRLFRRSSGTDPYRRPLPSRLAQPVR